MKTKTILFAVLASVGFGQNHVQQADMTQLSMELSRIRQQLQVVEARQNRPAQTYVAGETAEQRKARHAQAVAEAEAAYKADWQAKNPLLSSMRAPKFHKQLAERAIAESDAQTAANAGQRAAAQPKPDPQIAAMKKRIQSLEAQIKAAKTRK